VWGLTALAINTDVLKVTPTSIDILWDPKMTGRVSIRDDAVEAIQIGALATGQNINDISDLDAVEAKLEALLPQLRTYWSSENDWNQFMAAGDMDVASYWSGSASRSIEAGFPIEFVVPQEGAIGWMDGLSVSAASQHSDAAYAFIDYMISPEFYVKWADDGAPASANAVAAAALPDDAFNRRILGDKDIVARVQFMRPITDEKREEYLQIWQGLKAAQ
jgi:spermidine/putrescine transport system substrate-binding protein